MVSILMRESLDFPGQASAKYTTVVKSENARIRGSKSSPNREECTVRLQYVLKRTCLNRCLKETHHQHVVLMGFVGMRVL